MNFDFRNTKSTNGYVFTLDEVLWKYPKHTVVSWSIMEEEIIHIYIYIYIYIYVIVETFFLQFSIWFTIIK